MRRVCQAHGANLLRIEPQWPDDAATVGALESLGFAAGHQRIMPPRTMLVDLARSPEAIWKSFHSNARNRVRLALKRGVAVRVGTADDVTTFARLMTATVRRHGLAIDPSQQSVAAARVFPSDAMRVFIARAAGADIAGIVALACGATTTYLWGATASTDEARRVHPNQLLQWTAMQWARDRGCAIYDLFGIPDHNAAQLEAEYPHRNDGMWNLYRFKRGFGGRVHRHVGTFDCRLPA